MSNRWRSRVWAIASALGCVGAHAEEWFQIEVIGFRYAQTDAGNWASEPTAIDLSHASPLQAPPASEPLSSPAVDIPFQALPAHELHLVGAYQALQRAGDIIPVFHLGWRQRDTDSRVIYVGPPSPVLNEVSDVSAELPRLEGSVRMTGAREALTLQAEFIAREGDSVVPIRETRKLIPGELHYLDHALGGVLVQAIALAPPDDAVTSEEDPPVAPD